MESPEKSDAFCGRGKKILRYVLKRTQKQKI